MNFDATAGGLGNNRAAWLCHIRQALEAADSVARQLVVTAEVAPDALAILARLDVIRSEVDALQATSALLTPPCDTPLWMQLPPLGS